MLTRSFGPWRMTDSSVTVVLIQPVNTLSHSFGSPGTAVTVEVFMMHEQRVVALSSTVSENTPKKSGDIAAHLNADRIIIIE